MPRSMANWAALREVLMLSRYGRLGASSRMRFYQYLPWLEATGISITAAPLFLASSVMRCLMLADARKAQGLLKAHKTGGAA